MATNPKLEHCLRCNAIEDFSLARAPDLETAGSFLGMRVVIDPALPPNVIEFRDAQGRLLARELIGPVS